MENQRIQLTKYLLKNAIMEILQTKNIEKITVYEICERAGVNRTTFYKYYGSPSELLNEIKQEMFEELTGKLEDVDTHQIESLTQAIQYMDSDVRRWRIVLSSTNAYDFVEQLLRYLSLDEMLDQVLKLQKRYGARQREYLHTFIYSGCYAMLTQWIFREDRESPEEMTRLLTMFLINLNQSV